jgi:hypothetical protein
MAIQTNTIINEKHFISYQLSVVGYQFPFVPFPLSKGGQGVVIGYQLSVISHQFPFVLFPLNKGGQGVVIPPLSIVSYQSSDYGPRTTDYGLRTSDFGH